MAWILESEWQSQRLGWGASSSAPVSGGVCNGLRVQEILMLCVVGMEGSSSRAVGNDVGKIGRGRGMEDSLPDSNTECGVLLKKDFFQ